LLSSVLISGSIAYAWTDDPQLDVGERLEIEYFGQRFAASIQAEPLLDPKSIRMRG